MRRALVSGALLTLTVLLSGCSLLSPASSAPSTNADDGGLVDPVEQRYPPLADVTIVSCKGSGGTWKITGTVSNPTKTPFVYTISVDVIDKAGNDVADVDAVPGPPVKPLAKATWKATVTGVPAAGATCQLASVYRN
jgi:hypothetical protein